MNLEHWCNDDERGKLRSSE